MLDFSLLISSPIRVLSIFLEKLRWIEDVSFYTCEVVLDFKVPLLKFFVIFEFSDEVRYSIKSFIWVRNLTSL